MFQYKHESEISIDVSGSFFVWLDICCESKLRSVQMC